MDPLRDVHGDDLLADTDQVVCDARAGDRVPRPMESDSPTDLAIARGKTEACGPFAGANVREFISRFVCQSRRLLLAPGLLFALGPLSDRISAKCQRDQ